MGRRAAGAAQVHPETDTKGIAYPAGEGDEVGKERRAVSLARGSTRVDMLVHALDFVLVAIKMDFR